MNSVQNKIEIRAKLLPGFNEILTEEALNFIQNLHERFNDRRLALLKKREERQLEIDIDRLPKFLSETKEIRQSDWTVAPLPEDLLDRRVEITGPVDKKMIINGLNSGANVFMADFEDSNSPTWENIISGQVNLRDAVRKTITYENPTNKKFYKLNDKTAILMVRPRGWHLYEKNILINDEYISASLLDFGLFFFHNAKELIKRGTGPYFYLPKLESHLEARLWNDVFIYSQEQLGIPKGTIKATVLIETILAAFEMDEILFELKEHSAGLNCGRWDYIFSYIKKFKNHPQFILPDRSHVTMTSHFMRSYSLLLIKTCHKRNVHAMGGMAAQIPIKDDGKKNQIAIRKVQEDKEREAKDGHDGTWVAHPGLVQTAKEIFDRFMPEKNQISNKRDGVKITENDLLKLPEGTITLEGLKTNIDVGIQYLKAWLDGNGCVPIYNLMEDAATAEISRSQVWQWIHNPSGKFTEDEKKITKELVGSLIKEKLQKLLASIKDENEIEKLNQAGFIFEKLVIDDNFVEFLTLPAYSYLD